MVARGKGMVERSRRMMSSSNDDVCEGAIIEVIAI
jgi:hypothetical protein